MPNAQGSHMYVLTLQAQTGRLHTMSGTHTPAPGRTRFDLLTQLRKDAVRLYPNSRMDGAIVLFFSVEPNAL
ncbi:hypothetical protein [Streptomyces sp. NPDC048659]|uniref:hypothetical protein n=1 Tax=Streptomyces sp. NPDC048659 TaxID=3155489 RepID=UPI00341B1549